MSSSGSGFVVAENGDILTCTHLVQREPGVLDARERAVLQRAAKQRRNTG